MIIETKGLVKIYNDRKVVDDVSITVEQGSVVGLLVKDFLRVDLFGDGD